MMLLSSLLGTALLCSRKRDLMIERENVKTLLPCQSCVERGRITPIDGYTRGCLVTSRTNSSLLIALLSCWTWPAFPL